MDIRSYGLNTLDDGGLNTVEKIINDSKLIWNTAQIEQDDRKHVVDIKVRACKTCFLSNKKLDKLFRKMISDYNTHYSGWNYDLSFIEPIQLTHYYEGDFYDWHTDTLNSHNDKQKKHTRKVSATVFLNDPDEYEGGELDIEIEGPKKDPRYETFKLHKGSIVVFPSRMWHRVRPVTSGVRKSLILWIQGPSFR